MLLLRSSFNSFMAEVPIIIETSLLICRASQWTRICMIENSCINTFLVFLSCLLEYKSVFYRGYDIYSNQRIISERISNVPKESCKYVFGPPAEPTVSYKFGPVRKSIRDGHFPRRAFLENASFNFSETWHEVRVL